MTRVLNAEKIFTIGQLSESIRRNLLQNNERIRGVWFQGEISDWKPYPSGHYYLTLKDEKAQIAAVLFSFHLRGCTEEFLHLLRQGTAAVKGLQVQVAGELDVNLKRGQYSIKIFQLRLASGLGAKMEAFNALKARLEREGLNKLDHPERRRPLPFLPHRIGIVTSPAGAVIHDMCVTLTRRFENLEIRLFPAKVQGEGAAKSIAAGLAYFNAPTPDAWRADVVIVGRGGGSAEDLWAFNEEEAVLAVARSAIPVISAVGHESDVTLCDYAADLRAGTPSIAAERAVPVKAELAARVTDAARRLARAPMARVESWAQQLDYLNLKMAQAPQMRLNLCAARVDRAAVRLEPALKELAARRAQAFERVRVRLDAPPRAALETARHRVERLAAKLTLLNPVNVMQRGYSITFDGAGRVVTSAKEIKPGDRLTTRLREGEIRSTVC